MSTLNNFDITTPVIYQVCDEVNGAFFESVTEAEAEAALAEAIDDGYNSNLMQTYEEKCSDDALSQMGMLFRSKEEALADAEGFYHLFRVTRSLDDFGALDIKGGRREEKIGSIYVGAR